jgi:hypothetical protein
MTEAILLAVLGMRHSRIGNYIAPGLTSWLVGGQGHGKVRLFTCDRDTREWIVPHSHRFDFTCLVLAGRVTNVLLRRTYRCDRGNAYAVGTLRAPTGGIGEYEFTPGEEAEYFEEIERAYEPGETYSMEAREIHTIRFSRDSSVLFFEGPETADSSVVLEPWSCGRRVPTFATHPWMFDRAQDTSSPELS